MAQMPSVLEMPEAKRKTDFADFIIVVACVLAMSFMVLLLAAMPFIPALAGSRDYLVYWATGQQLVHHANPYDAEQMGRLEHQAGLTLAGSYYMRNPPWALPLAFPLGFIPERVGALPWSLLCGAPCVMRTARCLWISLLPMHYRQPVSGRCLLECWWLSASRSICARSATSESRCGGR